jgi:hypothetical protein
MHAHEHKRLSLSLSSKHTHTLSVCLCVCVDQTHPLIAHSNTFYSSSLPLKGGCVLTMGGRCSLVIMHTHTHTHTHTLTHTLTHTHSPHTPTLLTHPHTHTLTHTNTQSLSFCHFLFFLYLSLKTLDRVFEPRIYFQFCIWLAQEKLVLHLPFAGFYTPIKNISSGS